jgi:hypothetical protein
MPTITFTRDISNMLNFTEIGHKIYDAYITHRTLQIPSTSSAPVQKSKLFTLAPTKIVSKKKMKNLEKELKDTTKLSKRRLEWCRLTGEQYDPSTEQYSVFPRALCDSNGQLHSGIKCTWHEKLNVRYNYNVIHTTLPEGWVPEVVIIDGMFTLNIKPMRCSNTISDHAKSIFLRFAAPYYALGAKEVHIIYDKVPSKRFDPKQFERSKRDSMAFGKQHEHQCIEFTPHTRTPINTWNNHLSCRKCKHSIIEALGMSYIVPLRYILSGHQILVIAGCFKGQWENDGIIISGDDCNIPQFSDLYTTNIEESDLRIWRHVGQSKASKVLIYSPDTDVYNIGMGTYDEMNKDIIMQVNVPSKENKYVYMSKLIEAFKNDPDLAMVNSDTLNKVMQVLY